MPRPRGSDNVQAFQIAPWQQKRRKATQEDEPDQAVSTFAIAQAPAVQQAHRPSCPHIPDPLSGSPPEAAETTSELLRQDVISFQAYLAVTDSGVVTGTSISMMLAIQSAVHHALQKMMVHYSYNLALIHCVHQVR